MHRGILPPIPSFHGGQPEDTAHDLLRGGINADRHISQSTFQIHPIEQIALHTVSIT